MKQTTVQSLSSHLAQHVRIANNLCKSCNQATSNKSFCSNSCAASYNNRRRAKKVEAATNKIQDRKQKLFERYLNGEVTERPSLRKYFVITKGYRCSMCGLSEWNGQHITLIVDHIDGNAGNNKPENLRLLCPNCNSQTPTFGGRNKGSGRKARGLSLS